MNWYVSLWRNGGTDGWKSPPTDPATIHAMPSDWGVAIPYRSATRALRGVLSGPRNVRELENAMEPIAILCEQPVGAGDIGSEESILAASVTPWHFAASHQEMSDKIFSPSNIHKLEDPERLNWLPPQEVTRLLNLTSGMSIADIGAGSGFFSLPFARAVEPGGRLFAVDLQPEMLEFLRAKLRSDGSPRNLELIAGEATATNLKDASCDLVFLGNVWHELDDHARVLREIARILRSAGRVAILDWRTDVPNPPEPPAVHRVAAAEAAAALQTAGWAVIQSTGVGTYSYLVIALV